MYVCMYEFMVTHIARIRINRVRFARGQLNRENEYSPVPVRA